MKHSSILLLLAFSAVLLLLPDSDIQAATTTMVICKKTSNNAINIRSGRCRRGETRLSNYTQLQGTAGTNGSNGADGADGSLRVFGDGSAGALEVSSTDTFVEENPQFTDVHIASGVTLYVDSGTVIRCTGSFLNEGTIVVDPYASGAYIGSNASAAYAPPLAAAGFGIAKASGSIGAFGTNSGTLAGGAGGVSINEFSARQILRPGPLGGSGGGVGLTGTGGAGGGTFTVIAAGSITNSGTIQADGQSISVGAAGGGGGIIILASQTQVTNSLAGTLSVKGGAGGASFSNVGASGGGGGGFVHLISTSAPVNAGTINYAGGAAGSNGAVGTVSTTPRIGGAGGGSCYGAGGIGGNVSSAGTSSGTGAGVDGAFLTTTADPMSLM